MIPPKRTPYSWFYFPRYPHHMKFLMQESSISLQILGRCPPKISHDTPWLSVLKQPGWSPWKNSNEQSKRTHAKSTTSTLTSIYFLLLFVFCFFCRTVWFCFWLLFVLLASLFGFDFCFSKRGDGDSRDSPRSAWSRCPTRAACWFFQKYLDAKSGISWG